MLLLTNTWIFCATLSFNVLSSLCLVEKCTLRHDFPRFLSRQWRGEQLWYCGSLLTTLFPIVTYSDSPIFIQKEGLFQINLADICYITNTHDCAVVSQKCRYRSLFQIIQWAHQNISTCLSPWVLNESEVLVSHNFTPHLFTLRFKVYNW